jgi:hypothetical protein
MSFPAYGDPKGPSGWIAALKAYVDAGGGGGFLAGNQVRYVQGSGVGLSASDSNNGLSPVTPMATIQAAYNDLPATNLSGGEMGGGTIILLGGFHDVGAGCVMDSPYKHAVITSLTGDLVRNAVAWGGTNFASGWPTIMTSGTPTFLIKCGMTNTSNGEGWAFRGLALDCTVSTVVEGIRFEDTLYAVVENCTFEGGASAPEKYGVRALRNDGTDSSYGRIRSNKANRMGICALGTGGNNNAWEISHNIKFNGDNSCAIVATDLFDSLILNNRIEMGSSGGKAAIDLLGSSAYNTITGNGGEGQPQPYVHLGASTFGNYLANNGSKDNTEADVYTDQSTNNLYAALKQTRFGTKTANYTFVWTDAGKTINMNLAGANTLTIPPQSSVVWPQGTIFYARQVGAGQTTITPGSGVTIRSRTGAKLAGQYAMAMIVRVNTDEWQLMGDLTV